VTINYWQRTSCIGQVDVLLGARIREVTDWRLSLLKTSSLFSAVIRSRMHVGFWWEKPEGKRQLRRLTLRREGNIKKNVR
jgi:hypothetical protein